MTVIRSHFPLILDRAVGLRGSIPWDLIAPHERQAKRNHGGQSLECLAERGGLAPSEALAVIEDRPWRPMPNAIEILERLVADMIK